MALEADRSNDYNNMYEMFDSIRKIEMHTSSTNDAITNFLKSSPFRVTVDNLSDTSDYFDDTLTSSVVNGFNTISLGIKDLSDTVNDFCRLIESSNTHSDEEYSSSNRSDHSEDPILSAITTTMSDIDRSFFKSSFDDILSALSNQPTQDNEDHNNDDIKKQIVKSGKDIEKSSNISDNFKSMLGGLGNIATAALGTITSAITSGVNSATKIFNDMGRRSMSRYQTQEDSLNDIMYQYGLSDANSAKQLYQNQFNVHSGHMTESERNSAVLPFQHRSAPEQREFNRNQRQSAINMGYNTEESVKVVTSELSKWKDIFEDINFESSTLFDQTMRFVDKTGETFDTIMSKIQSISTNYMVTPELLEEVSSGYARYMRTITNNNNSYTRSMSKMLTTVGKLEDSGVESQGFLDQIKTFQQSDISNASQQNMWKQFAVLGMDPMKQLTSNDPGQVLKSYTSELKKYFSGYDISNGADRMMVNTIAQEVFGMSQSEMENLYSLLDSNYSTEQDTNAQIISGIGTLNDYQERIANEAASYYDTATSGLWYVTNQMATDAQSTLRDLTNPALAEWYDMTQTWYSNTDGLIEFPDKAYTMMGAQMIAQGQSTDYLVNTLGGLAQTYMNVMSPIYDVLGQILSEISEDPAGFITGTLGEVVGGIGGIIGGAGNWVGSGVAGLATGKGLSEFNSYNFLSGYEGGFKAGTLGQMDFNEHMENGSGLAASINRYMSYGDTTPRNKAKPNKSSDTMDSILSYDPSMAGMMKGSELFTNSGVADYTNALNNSNITGNKYNKSESKSKSSYSSNSSKSNPFRKSIAKQKSYDLPVYDYSKESDSSNTKKKIKTQSKSHNETRNTIKGVSNSVKSSSLVTNKNITKGISSIGTYYNKWTRLFNETYKTYTSYISHQNKLIKETISNLSKLVDNDLKSIIGLLGSKGISTPINSTEKYTKNTYELLSNLFQKDKDTGGYLWNIAGLTSLDKSDKDHAVGGGSYNPFSDYSITSKYGTRKVNGKKEFHGGIDYKIPSNTKLRALDGGTILYSGSNKQYGNYIDLEGKHGYVYRYAHLNQRNVDKGDHIKRGELLGFSGSTGESSGPHLHLEIMNKDGDLINPENYFKSNAVPITDSSSKVSNKSRTKKLSDRVLNRLGMSTSTDFSNGASTEDNAKLVYTFFKQKGMSNENIAGILGNWTVESGIDPTTIEGYYRDKLKMTDTKLGFSKDLDSYTRNRLFPMYAGRVAINKEAYKASNGKSYPGLGLGQWTGPRAKSLVDVSHSKGRNWYDISSQLDFMTNEDSRSSWVREFIKDKQKTPEQAAYTFLSKWEGIVNSTQGKRKEVARNYFNKMKSWTVDTSSLSKGKTSRKSTSISSFAEQLSSLLKNTFNKDNNKSKVSISRSVDTTGSTVSSITDESKRWSLITGGRYSNRNSAYGIGRSGAQELQQSVTVSTKSGPRKMTTNKYLASMWKNLISDLTNAGFNVLELGSYNYRTKRGGSSLSSHAFGSAIDLNWSTSGMGWKQSPVSYNDWSKMSKSEKSKRIGYGSPFAKIIAKYNLDWGGSWSGSKDPMHISYVGDAPTSTVMSRVSKYATGGEVIKPTLSLVGEGGYKEYVITTDPQYTSKSRDLINKASRDVEGTASLSNNQSFDPIIDVKVDTESVVRAVETLSEVVKDGFEFIRRMNSSTKEDSSPKSTESKSNVIMNYV